MNKLDLKYRNNKLNYDELIQLRNRLNNMEDKDVESIMEDVWQNEHIDTSKISSSKMSDIKKRIDTQINKKSNHRIYYLYKLSIKVAAVIAFPLLLFTMFYLHKENTLLSSNEIVVSTNNNEHATITLPDGTSVSLNSNSCLKYSAAVYNKNERKVTFNGEAYFNVTKNIECPFTIDSKGLQVKVFGTKFNLLARNNENIARLALEQGRVSLTSLLSGKTVVLVPSQLAILDKAMGEITSSVPHNIKDASSWREGTKIFHSTPISTVIDCIEKSFNVRIVIREDMNMNDLFTGSINIVDIKEAIIPIERMYHLKAVISGNEVTFQ